MDQNNSLLNLNDTLFASLQRLSETEGDKLKLEIERAKAISGVSREIIDNAKLVLDAHRMANSGKPLPAMLECK